MYAWIEYSSYPANAGWLGGTPLFRSAERLASHHRSVLWNHLGGWPLGSWLAAGNVNFPFFYGKSVGKGILWPGRL